MASIVVLGSCNMDITVHTSRLPTPGETVLGGDAVRSLGGKGSNQAIAAARLGADVTLIGAVGLDAIGDEALATFATESIDVSHVARSDRPSGLALIAVDQAGENQIAVSPGANADVSVDSVYHARNVIETADVLLTQLETPVEAFVAAAQIAHKSSTTVILNPAPSMELPDVVWPLVDVCTPNQTELRQLTRSADERMAAQSLVDRGSNNVIVTKGGHGALWVSGVGVKEFEARKVTPVDTTGAGDAFNAGLAVGLAEAMSMVDAIQLGMRSGVLAVTKSGVLGSLATRHEVEKDFPW